MGRTNTSSLQVLTRKKAASKVGKSTSTIKAWESRSSRHYQPDWPKPFSLSGTSIGYFEHEIDEWLIANAAKRER
jgi:prophage regulatory protein